MRVGLTDATQPGGPIIVNLPPNLHRFTKLGVCDLFYRGYLQTGPLWQLHRCDVGLDTTFEVSQFPCVLHIEASTVCTSV
jgi:hypothetical protein